MFFSSEAYFTLFQIPVKLKGSSSYWRNCVQAKTAYVNFKFHPAIPTKDIGVITPRQG